MNNEHFNLRETHWDYYNNFSYTRPILDLKMSMKRARQDLTLLPRVKLLIGP